MTKAERIQLPLTIKQRSSQELVHHKVLIFISVALADILSHT